MGLDVGKGDHHATAVNRAGATDGQLERRRPVRCQDNARQIRETVHCDMPVPVAAAIDQVDQRVAFVGDSSSVLTMTQSTSASVFSSGTLDRGSSHRPSTPAR